MTIKEQFRVFLEHHPKMNIDKPGPKDMYTQLLDNEGLLNRQIIDLHIPYYTSGYTCIDPQYWQYVIKPLYEQAYHFEKGKTPMVRGTFWNHLATINKYIEFLTKLNRKEQDATIAYPVVLDNDVNITAALQQIYYGAPGTGKSHEIKEQTSGRTTYRITFHPDTDYASFVGAYKPTAIDVDMRDLSGHKIYEYGKILQQKHITYRFVRQSFLNAYLAAWREQAKEQPQPVFLIIEEINRGNCAQIFGDLFQLLDRGDSGFSEYPIVPDADLSRHVAEELGSLTIANTDAINAHYADQSDDMVSEIKNGTRLLLPNNLYIWATMNTSDQSLFPIDSAFKRRWDWKYIPISDAGKGWQIEVGKERYDWWQFLTKINAVIESSTESEDKKLGYFFCKADATATITAERFVGKVLFYLWNDVLKDYEPNDPAFIDSDGSRLKFNTLYTVDEGGHTKVDIERISTFMHKLELSPVNAEADNATDAEQQ